MKKKILIVDDEADVVEYLSRKLQRENYEPIVAYDGREGFEMLLQHKVDAVVTDIVMSGMDGYTLCQKLKEYDGLSDIPVVVCTAYPRKERMFRKLGIDDYLVKPFSFDDLFGSLRRIFSQISHTIKYKKVIVQTDKGSVIQRAVAQMRKHGFRIDVVVVPQSGNLIEESIRVKPDIVIFDASKRGIIPDDLITSLNSYVDLKGLRILFYFGNIIPSPQNADIVQELRSRCYAAGAVGSLVSLTEENFLAALLKHCQ